MEINKYSEIAAEIKKMIRCSRLKSGDKVPSIREACFEFKCSKATVIRAYEELEKEHILYSIPKSGYYIVDKNIIETKSSNFEIDFKSASPLDEVLPYREFQHSINQAIRLYKDSLFNYSDIQGLLSLRKTLQKHFTDTQIFTDPGSIFITSGSQQALYILSKMPFPNGKTDVLVEQPTYLGALKALEHNGIKVLGIERTCCGIDMDELERIFRSGSIKFLYTIPRFHNPTGFSYTNEQKKEILRLAEKYDTYIIEDDYLADLELNPKSDPMYSLGMPNRVIYLKSYSKTLLPGLRIGAAIFPKNLITIFGKYKMSCDIVTNVLSQGALEIYVKSGMFDAHIKKVKKYYSSRMADLKAACSCVMMDGFEFYVPETGLFASLTLPVSAHRVMGILELKNVYAVDIKDWFLAGFSKDNMLRISICRTDKEKIYKGIQTISDAVLNCFSSGLYNKV